MAANDSECSRVNKNNTPSIDASRIGQQLQTSISEQQPSTDAATALSDLAQDFEADGFLVLSSLLTPQFSSKLRDECMGIFDGVLEWLYLGGEIEFGDSYRISQTNGCAPLDANDGHGKEEKASEASSNKYEYPLKVGLKNGYRELVMRSPGRYELALLLSDFPSNNFYGMGCGGADYEGQWLLSTDMLTRAKEQVMQNNSSVENAKTKSEAERSPFNESDINENSCLKQLLEWVQDSSSNNESNANAHHDENCTQEQKHYPIDEKNMKTFMELVGAIFPSSNSDRSTRNIQNSSPRTIDQKRNDEYYLCNFSLLVATPGCPTQSWHADGGHASVTRHEPCHVFNVFVPLVDVPLAMGPTEVRPGTHCHTRNLAPMMLAARARKTLRPPVTPCMKMGDGLVFDYRILHRGRANVSDDAAAAVDLHEDDDLCHGEEDCRKGGRHRPVLVLTFARRWFVDVCNFPKNSIFTLDESR